MKMIKLIVMTVCTCAMFLIAGCGGPSPDAVALDFMKTLQAGKADEAYLKETCTEDTAKLFGLAMAMGKDELKKELEGVTFSVKETKIDGDTAVVTLVAEGKKGKKGGKDDDKLTLKKVDGKWKIDVKKEDMK